MRGDLWCVNPGATGSAHLSPRNRFNSCICDDHILIERSNDSFVEFKITTFNHKVKTNNFSLFCYTDIDLLLN